VTRYRVRRRQRTRRLWRLVFLALVVTLVVTAAFEEIARGSGRVASHTGQTARASASTGAAPRRASATASPNPRPLALAADSPVTTTLQRRLLAILRADRLLASGTAVCVYDLSGDRLVFARHSKTPLRPASNEKLVTTATALALWGPTHRFATDLYEDGSLAASGVFRGTLYLKGFGDPSLGSAAYQRAALQLRSARLSDFVAALRRAGIKRVVGRIVGDASYFDARRAVASWHADESEDCGPLSALSVDEGTGSRGHPVANPARYAAFTLTALLRHAGIRVSRTAATGVTPQGATLLYEDRSVPLARILASMDQRSDDFFAEMLTKGLGAAFGGKGSTVAGARLERAWARSSGMGLAGVVVADGSGLSYADRETSADLVRLLVVEARSPQWPVFYHSLAVAGESGTLASRMRHTRAQGNLHAKTGTLDVASGLSGYVTAANGHLLVFAILMNGDPFDLAAAQQAQDEIGVALARSRA
jgi:D-alanyl-D-alanine carboxypeptidase/D-alanyl-D-alanine-endopeptidase (penicillin-binding protein 4)